MMALDIQGKYKKKQSIKSRGKEIEGERHRCETGTGEHQFDGGTKIEADFVTHH